MKRFKQLYGVPLTRKKTNEIIFVLMALEAIFAFSYLGYIDFPMISSTTMHILVIVAAMILGIEGSVPVVCVFALTSMWIATYASSALDKLFSPFVSGAPVVSVMLALARVIFAIIASWTFAIYFSREHKHVYAGIAAIAVLNTLIHGAIILGVYYIFVPAVYREVSANMFAAPLFRDWSSYASAAAVCCCVHYILSKPGVRDHLSCLCRHSGQTHDKEYETAFACLKIGAGIIGVLCILYLRKKILGELLSNNIEITRSLNMDITAFLIQSLFAFACLFGIVNIIIQWINEFYTVREIEMNKKINEQSVKISIDALTGVFSRFAYNDTIASYADNIPDDLAVILIDINGLKAVNDTIGHKAGDELICGAASCISEAAGEKCKTFRIGGDEFVVLGNMRKDQVEEALTRLSTITSSWSGVKVKDLSVSAGYALACELAGYSVEDLVKEADKAMYEQKKEYYKGRSDRRSV